MKDGYFNFWKLQILSLCCRLASISIPVVRAMKTVFTMSNSFVSLPLDSNVLATRFVTWYVQKDSDTLTAIFYSSRCIFINLFLTLVNTTQITDSSNKHMTMSMSLFSLLLSQAYLQNLLICIFYPSFLWFKISDSLHNSCMIIIVILYRINWSLNSNFQGF